MNEETSLFNEMQPIKQSSKYQMLNGNPEEEYDNPNLNNNSTYMKIAIKYKLSPDFKSVFNVSKLGNSYGLCPDINGDPLILIGPQWHFFIITFLLSTIIYIFIYRSYINSSEIVMIKYMGWPLYLIWTMLFFFISLINPGYPRTNLESIRGSKQMSYCDKCELWNKPKSNTYHCNICDICIEGHKLHCFITGHCIGYKNKKYFYLFIFNTVIFLFYFSTVYYLNKKTKINN